MHAAQPRQQDAACCSLATRTDRPLSNPLDRPKPVQRGVSPLISDPPSPATSTQNHHLVSEGLWRTTAAAAEGKALLSIDATGSHRAVRREDDVGHGGRVCGGVPRGRGPSAGAAGGGARARHGRPRIRWVSRRRRVCAEIVNPHPSHPID